MIKSEEEARQACVEMIDTFLGATATVSAVNETIEHLKEDE